MKLEFRCARVEGFFRIIYEFKTWLTNNFEVQKGIFETYELIMTAALLGYQHYIKTNLFNICMIIKYLKSDLKLLS